jgi:hypothetical protein
VTPKKPSAEHTELFNGLTALLNKNTQKMDKREILAIVANIVGKVIAMQDQRTTTPEQAMEIVHRNIQQGNAEAVAQLMGPPGGHA